MLIMRCWIEHENSRSPLLVVGLELLVSVHLSVDSRRLDLLGIDRIYGAKVNKDGGDVAKRRNARWRVHCWELCPTKFTGARDFGEKFFTLVWRFPLLFTSTRIYGGWGWGGVCLCCCKLVSKAVLPKSSAFLSSFILWQMFCSFKVSLCFAS